MAIKKPLEYSRAVEIARGLHIKRTNAVTALITGGILTVTAGRQYPETLRPIHLFLAILVGIFYANAFEYVLHRFLLHWGKGFLVQRHALHHDSTGSPLEARYVNFATSPLVVVLVFVLNAPAAFFLQSVTRTGLATGMLLGFTVYYIAYEEIHWRIHFGGWLPSIMRGARRHHMLHHGGFKGRYSVFLPIFDWFFDRNEWKRQIS